MGCEQLYYQCRAHLSNCRGKGDDGVTSLYLIREHAVLKDKPSSGLSRDAKENIMVKLQSIICSLHLVNKLAIPDKLPMTVYNNEAAKDNSWCFQELKHKVEGAKNKVFVEKN